MIECPYCGMIDVVYIEGCDCGLEWVHIDEPIESYITAEKKEKEVHAVNHIESRCNNIDDVLEDKRNR